MMMARDDERDDEVPARVRRTSTTNQHARATTRRGRRRSWQHVRYSRGHTFPRIGQAREQGRDDEANFVRRRRKRRRRWSGHLAGHMRRRSRVRVIGPRWEGGGGCDNGGAFDVDFSGTATTDPRRDAKGPRGRRHSLAGRYTSLASVPVVGVLPLPPRPAEGRRGPVRAQAMAEGGTGSNMKRTMIITAMRRTRTMRRRRDWRIRRCEACIIPNSSCCSRDRDPWSS